VRLRAVTVVRLIGALALGHTRFLSMRRPARGRPGGKYTSAHRRRTKGLTTESASRPRSGRALWKTPVLYSGPLHPPANPPGAGQAPVRPQITSPEWLSTVVERCCGYACR
jgi:hypothetical protein